MIQYHSTILAGFTGLLIGLSTLQDAGPRPAVFTTPPQRIAIRFAGEPPGYQNYDGQVTLTLLEAGSDDTLRALLVLTLPPGERQRLVKRGLELPETIHREELRLNWHRGTSCPDIDLDLPAVKFTGQGREMSTEPTRVRIDVSLRTVETLPQLLCSWTRQINSRRPRLGIVMAINRLLIPDGGD